jgi:hypothetical protein
MLTEVKNAWLRPKTYTGSNIEKPYDFSARKKIQKRARSQIG